MSSKTLDALVSPRRFGKFASVGAVGAVFDLTTSALLMLRFDVSPEVAKLLGAEVAILAMFFLNERWTFPDAITADSRSPLVRILKSNLVRSGGLGLQFLVVWWFRSTPIPLVYGGVDYWLLASFPVAIGASVLSNYVLESVVTWRVGTN